VTVLRLDERGPRALLVVRPEVAGAIAGHSLSVRGDSLDPGGVLLRRARGGRRLGRTQRAAGENACRERGEGRERSESNASGRHAAIVTAFA
jgi:hypothetical protein